MRDKGPTLGTASRNSQRPNQDFVKSHEKRFHVNPKHTIATYSRQSRPSA